MPFSASQCYTSHTCHLTWLLWIVVPRLYLPHIGTCRRTAADKVLAVVPRLISCHSTDRLLICCPSDRLWMLPLPADFDCCHSRQTLDCCHSRQTLDAATPGRLWVVISHALPHYGHMHFHSCGLDNIDGCSRPDLFASWHISTPGI
jgi:hypothetical protein